MTKTELNNCNLIVDFFLNRKEPASLRYAAEKLSISKSEVRILVEKYILPNKLLNNNDHRPGGFVLIKSDRTAYLLETKVLESVYKAEKRKRTDKLLASRNLRISFVKNIGWLIASIFAFMLNIFLFWKIITQ